MNYKERYKSLKEELSKMEDKTSNLALLLTDSMHDLEDQHPELKESEGEQHHKWILEYLYDGLRKSDEQFKDHFKTAIDWLKAQGEQKGTLCDTCRKAQPSHSCQDITALGRCALEKQGELMPTWSEEDERDFDTVYGIIYNSCNAEDASRLIEWLKSLKDRVQPQPKEWSKKDENNILFLTSIIEECFKDKEKITLYGDTVCANFTKENVIDRLKSLKGRYTWKPNGEQMNGLKEAIEFLGCTKTRREQLQSLYEQLKKLMEE